MPGGATIDIGRDSMVAYLRQGKKVVTATLDNRLDLWREGSDVILTADGFVVCDSADEGGDNVGNLPDFRSSDPHL
jgi:hypothetical protein